MSLNPGSLSGFTAGLERWLQIEVRGRSEMSTIHDKQAHQVVVSLSLSRCARKILYMSGHDDFEVRCRRMQQSDVRDEHQRS
jgi:hypothetical protein